MDTRIQVSIEQLTQTVDKIGDVAASIERAKQAIETVISQTEPIWVGEARDWYAEEAKKICGKLKQQEECISKRKLQLQQAIQVYVDTEDSNKQAVTTLSANQIF